MADTNVNYQNYSGNLPSGNFNYGQLVGLDQSMGLSAGNQPTFIQNGNIYQVKDNGNNTFGLQQIDTVANRQGEAAQNLYQQQQGSAISGLQAQKSSLAESYGSLLANVTGAYQPLVNQATENQNNVNASRGLVSNIGLGANNEFSALNPVYAAEGQGSMAIQSGSIADSNTLQQAIAAAQQSGAQFGAELPLQYGSLQLQSQLIPSEAAANYGQASQLSGANATTLASALIKAQTPQMASNGIVFAPTSAGSSQNGYYYPGNGGGGNIDITSLARRFVSSQNTKRQNASTISKYVS